MPCGLYGKLPVKRDFVALSVPRAFLSIWEPWIDAGLTDSRAALGAAWQSAFYETPIWRFFLGADICGTRVLGATMPSVDAVGRCYPLTLIATPRPEATFLGPDTTPHESWFAAVEDCLLAALEPETDYEATRKRVADLAEPSDDAGAEAASLYQAACDPDNARPLAVLFAAAAPALDSKSFWWTPGGARFAALAWSQEAMPLPFLFTSMLTGRFPAPASPL